MKKTMVILLFIFYAGIPVQAQNVNFINIIVPERDSASIASKYLRLNGSTMPGSALYINGTEYKVWSTGAFAGYPELTPGNNTVTIESVHPAGGISTKKITVTSRSAEPEKAVSEFMIEHAGVVPARDQDLVSGDLLQVRMKALTGCKAFFLGDKPMTELPVEQAGIGGIYQGIYRFQDGDSYQETPVAFTLTSPDGDTISTKSNNTISVNTGKFPAAGLTKGNFSYLCYGLGEDRLGGAKMGYLDSLVCLTISGQTGNLYRVSLGESQTAYIPSNMVTLMPAGTPMPYSLSDSWSVYGDGKCDFVKIGFSQRLPYVSRFEINPLKIVVDVYGAVSNTNWITQLNSTREIRNVFYEQTGKNVLRVTIELVHNQAWGYSVYYERNRLVIKIKHQPDILKLNHLTIGLDAGHGGPASGAVGSTGVKEKDINLAVVRKLKSALEKLGAKVVLSREGDDDISTTDRWKIMREYDPDILLSIHCNATGNGDPNKIKGTSTYYKHIAYRPLSKIMYDELLSTGLAEFGNVGSFNFTLNAPTEFPNTLLELAFLSNPEDEMHLLDPKFQNTITSRVVSGLQQYLRQCKTGK